MGCWSHVDSTFHAAALMPLLAFCFALHFITAEQYIGLQKTPLGAPNPQSAIFGGIFVWLTKVI